MMMMKDTNLRRNGHIYIQQLLVVTRTASIPTWNNSLEFNFEFISLMEKVLFYFP